MAVQCNYKSNNSSENSESPNLQNCDYGTVLFLGSSGSGKSYALKEILQKLEPKIVYAINVRDSEYVENLKNVISWSFEKVEKIKENSVVVVEDIIALNKKQEEQLRQLLNWHAHHKKLKVFCVSHNIFKTSLYNCLSYFRYIVFTSALGNLHLFKQTFANYFQISPEIVYSWQLKVQKFAGAQGVYFYFCTGTRIFYATNNIGDSKSSKELGRAEPLEGGEKGKTEEQNKQREILQKRFEIFFKGRKNAAQANAVFSIIVNCIDPQHITPVDLTLTFNSTRGGKKNISLPDYIDSLLQNDSKRPPTVDQIVVHRYVNSKCKIPDLFVLNRHY